MENDNLQNLQAETELDCRDACKTTGSPLMNQTRLVSCSQVALPLTFSAPPALPVSLFAARDTVIAWHKTQNHYYMDSRVLRVDKGHGYCGTQHGRL